MLREWQFQTLFVLAVLGILVMLFGDPIGIHLQPEVSTIIGTVLAFVLTQHHSRDRKDRDHNDRDQDSHDDDASSSGGGAG